MVRAPSCYVLALGRTLALCLGYPPLSTRSCIATCKGSMLQRVSIIGLCGSKAIASFSNHIPSKAKEKQSKGPIMDTHVAARVSIIAAFAIAFALHVGCFGYGFGFGFGFGCGCCFFLSLGFCPCLRFCFCFVLLWL